ncbi:MAG: recombinase family protein, partial [Oscillospiraceae bacterium]|nr:recombinase family protein [Oscillospiraceae bacterium]
MAKIIKIEQAVPMIQTKKKVAAYARISMESERMNHSLSAQISYYSSLIQKNPDWQYAGVFADDGVSGTGMAKRSEFRRMIETAESGGIDIILTKSIQRFARNTVDLLETVRNLKDIGVEVRFEKEHINSMSGDGELMMTILASFAQEESRSISDNVKWGTRKRFEKGIPNGHFQIYGYRWEGDRLVIEPEEAKIVRLIYDNFLNGLSAEATEKQLEEMGVKSYKGMHFSNSSIRQILSNITYTGNLLFQKEYVSDPITGKSKINRGELPQYFVEDTHEAIIPMETYQAVQRERERRREFGALANWSINTSCFTSKIKCGVCGKSYRRSGKRQRKNPDEVYYIWICRTKSDKGAKYCSAKSIPEKTLKALCAEVLGMDEFDGDVFSEKVEQITVIGEDTLEFH